MNKDDFNTVSKNVAYCKEENIHIILANILEYFIIWVSHITNVSTDEFGLFQL